MASQTSSAPGTSIRAWVGVWRLGVAPKAAPWESDVSLQANLPPETTILPTACMGHSTRYRSRSGALLVAARLAAILFRLRLWSSLSGSAPKPKLGRSHIFGCGWRLGFPLRCGRRQYPIGSPSFGCRFEPIRMSAMEGLKQSVVLIAGLLVASDLDESGPDPSERLNHRAKVDDFAAAVALA